MIRAQGIIPPDPLIALSQKPGAPEVYSLYDPATNGVTATLVIRLGAFYEQPSENGFSMILKYAFWKLAASHYDNDAFRQRLDSINARIGTFSGPGYLSFEVRTDSAHVWNALKLLSECSHDLALENISLETIRSACITELKQRDNDPERLILEACLDKCFGGDGYRIHGRPSPIVLFGSSMPQFRGFLEHCLAAEVLSIWVSGHIPAADVRQVCAALPWGIEHAIAPLSPVLHLAESDSVAYTFYLDGFAGTSLRLCFPVFFSDSLVQTSEVASWCCRMMNHPGWQGFSFLEEKYHVTFQGSNFHGERDCGMLVMNFDCPSPDSLPAFTAALLAYTAAPEQWLVDPDLAETVRNDMIWDYLDQADATWSYNRLLWEQWALGGYHRVRMQLHYLQFLGHSAISDFFLAARTSAKPSVVVVANPYLKMPVIPLAGVNTFKDTPDRHLDSVTSTQQRLPLPEDIRFSSGYFLDNPASAGVTLEYIISTLKQHPELSLVITGHSDRMGNPSAREMIALGRGILVREKLVVAGVAPERLIVVNASDTMPVYLGDDVQGQRKNRRVSFAWK